MKQTNDLHPKSITTIPHNQEILQNTLYVSCNSKYDDDTQGGVSLETEAGDKDLKRYHRISITTEVIRRRKH